MDADAFRGSSQVNSTNHIAIYSFHTGGANVATADGAAHFLKEQTDPAVVLALLTRAGGEVIRDQDWR
jgi:prepilin-type processing-associated H-X9-DG protein